MSARVQANTVSADGAVPIEKQTSRNPDFVQSLARGLMVIQSFDEDHRRQTLSDVARSTGFTRATTRRLLLTLQRLNFVTSRGREFSLAPKVLALGYAYLSALGAPAIAQSCLETLSGEVHESSSMTVLDGSDIVYVARVSTKRIFSLSLGVGSRLPAYTTSTGRMLMAYLKPEHLDEVLHNSEIVAHTNRSLTNLDKIKREVATARSQGWYLLDQELELGIVAVAAPVSDPSGVIAAINVTTTVARRSERDLTRNIVPKVVDTAAKISALLQTPQGASG